MIDLIHKAIMKFLKSSQEIRNIFELLGDDENAISMSIAWAMHHCKALARSIVFNMLEILEMDEENLDIKVQTSETDKGITDIEITDYNHFHIIIEAKKGWELPPLDQLNKYAFRASFREKSAAKVKALVTLSECSRIYADHYQATHLIDGIPVIHISYSEIHQAIDEVYSIVSHQEKHLLLNLQNYLERFINMQKQNSNEVLVVSLGRSKPDGCELSWIDIVEKKGVYFHPVGQGWPKEPLNYIAFRYDGVLKSIHHIEGYHVTRTIHEHIHEVPEYEEEFPHFIYRIGPAIKPSHVVPTGDKILWNARRWCYIDTLLTSRSISEAYEISNRRKKAQD